MDPPPPTEGVVPEEEPALFAAGRWTPRAHAAGQVGDVSLVRNLSLKAASGMPVSSKLAPADGDEASVATNGKGIVLYTTNSDDAISFNGGRSFSELNPRTVFRTLAGGFCCDQVVTYIPKYDLFVWVLQYQRGANGVPDNASPNALRVATATSAQLAASATANWTSYIWAPSSFGLRGASSSTGALLDRPMVAFTSNMLYFTAGAFDTQLGAWQSVVWRLKLQQLPSISWAYFRVPFGPGYNGCCLVRPAQNAPDQNGVYGFYQYFAQRKNTSMLNVFEWAECCKPSLPHEVKVPSVATKETSSAAQHDPDWLGRHGPKQAGQVVAGAYAGGVVWFAWQAGRVAAVAEKQPSGLTLDRDVKMHDQPVIEAVGIDPAKFTRVGYAKIEYKDFATALPQLRGDSSGDLAIAFAFGGPTLDPTAAVGFLGNKGYAAAVTVSGQQADGSVVGDPAGDYFGLALDPEQPHCFVAANSAVKDGGRAQNYYDPHYAVFGRAASACKTPEYVKAIGRVPVPPPPPQPSSMRLSCPASGQAGTPLTITGTITPAVANASVTIVYDLPDGSRLPRRVATDAQGNFRDSLVPTASQTGDWNVRASWAGNSQYLASDAVCVRTTTVTPAPPPPPGQQQAALTLNCPGNNGDVVITFQGSVAVTGSLTPAVNGSMVVITYMPPSGANIVHTVQTAADGSYSDSVVVNGDQVYMPWTVQAHFNGDATRTSADASSCTFTPRYN